MEGPGTTAQRQRERTADAQGEKTKPGRATRGKAEADATAKQGGLKAEPSCAEHGEREGSQAKRREAGELTSWVSGDGGAVQLGAGGLTKNPQSAPKVPPKGPTTCRRRAGKAQAH